MGNTTTTALSYREGGVEFEACLVHDPDAAPRPLVLVAHAWAGQGELERSRAAQLADLGYAGCALDVYGKGVQGSSAEENTALMTPLMADRRRLARRLIAGMEAAKAAPGVDSGKVAAIGFCFGGLCVLDLARRGVGLRGVVAFHGLLGAPDDLPVGQQVPGDSATKARVLALHGHDDPLATPDQVQEFEAEMSARGHDWQIHVYGGTVHAFTNPEAKDPASGMVYRPIAERRAWRSMQGFLEDAFATRVS